MDYAISINNPTSGIFIPVLLCDIVKSKRELYKQPLSKIYIKPSELAKELGCSRQHIYRTGKFKKVKIDNKIYIKLA